eukprot:symbB.v1.2.025204.t2/scaffold2437.1/size79084/1
MLQQCKRSCRPFAITTNFHRLSQLGLQQCLARQKAVAIEVLNGRSKVQLTCSVLRCFSAWRQWLVEAKAEKWREAEAERVRTQLEDRALQMQGRALSAFRVAKYRAISLQKVADLLFQYQLKITKVQLFLSWRLCKLVDPKETPAEVETETFSKAWYQHKEELQQGREQVIQQMLDTGVQESTLMDQAVAKAERVAESVAEKMYQQLCMELVKVTFDSWHQETRRSIAKREAEASLPLLEEQLQSQQALEPSHMEDDLEKRQRMREEEAMEEMRRQRDAAEREALQRQQQLAAAEREALVEQIKAARLQQSFEMEMLKDQVARAEDARRSQQEELERLKEEVTKGSVYQDHNIYTYPTLWVNRCDDSCQEIIQQFRSGPSGYPAAVPVPQAMGDMRVEQAPNKAVVTESPPVTTRSISVEAVPELPKYRSQRPNPRSLELGRNQAEMLERMLIKVQKPWALALGWRPSESRVRDVPWQTPPEDPLLPRPRGQNWQMSAEMAKKGLQKWSTEPEGDLTTADLYEAAARAHATFASWAVSSVRRHMSGNQPELSPEEEAGEQAVLRASQSISADVMEELEQFAMQPSSSWPPPLLPPRPVLPGDTGWDERIRHVAEPRRRLFGAEHETTEDVLLVESDGYLTSFRALPSDVEGQPKENTGEPQNESADAL